MPSQHKKNIKKIKTLRGLFSPSLWVGRDFTPLCLCSPPLQSAQPRMQFTVAFSPITLICVPDVMGWITAKTDGRNSLQSKRGSKPISRQNELSLNDTYSPKAWYSCCCRTARCDESLWGKPSRSATYLPPSSLVLRKSFSVCNHNLIRADQSCPLRQFLQHESLKVILY